MKSKCKNGVHHSFVTIENGIESEYCNKCERVIRIRNLVHYKPTYKGIRKGTLGISHFDEVF